MKTNYPEYRKHLQGLMGQLRTQIPGPMKGFGLLHQESMKAGALSVKQKDKQKELMSLAIGIASRCDGCIAFHTHETLAVAVSMGGGPALMYAAHALEAMEQFAP